MENLKKLGIENFPKDKTNKELEIIKILLLEYFKLPYYDCGGFVEEKIEELNNPIINDFINVSCYKANEFFEHKFTCYDFFDEYGSTTDHLSLVYLLKMYFVSKLYPKKEISDISYVEEKIKEIDFENFVFFKTITEIDDVFFELLLRNKYLNYKHSNFIKHLFKMHYTSYYYNFIKEIK